jgi:hypothetical protein
LLGAEKDQEDAFEFDAEVNPDVEVNINAI